MSTLYGSNATDVGTAPFTDIANANGAPDGLDATADISIAVDAFAKWDADLSVVSTLTGLSASVQCFGDHGSGAGVLLSVQYTDSGNSNVGSAITINELIPDNEVGDIALSFGALSLAEVQSIRHAIVRFQDQGAGTPLHLDSITFTYTASASTFTKGKRLFLME